MDIKRVGTFDLENMVFIEEKMQVLAMMDHKLSERIVASLERSNIGQKISSPKETYEVICCISETTEKPVSSRSHNKQSKLSPHGQ